MLRKTLLACSVALPLGLLGAAPALADTDVEVHFGVPFYTYQVSPRYRYYEDYGWYDAYAYPRFHRAYRVYDDDDDYVIYNEHYDHYDDDGDYVVVSPGY
jgi:hypothetical protein